MKDHEPIDSSRREQNRELWSAAASPRVSGAHAPISLIGGDCPPAPEPLCVGSSTATVADKTNA